MKETEVQALVDRCADLADASVQVRVPSGYRSVPLCGIDAIFSIGVRYEGVENVVQKYKSHWAEKGVDADTEAHTVRDFLEEFQDRSDLAGNVFHNRQRTSSRGGVLKADAVVELLKVLDEEGVQTTAQLRDRFDDPQLDVSIRSVHGQASGISAKYLFLLAGVEDAVKPDRMIVRFVGDSIGRRVTPIEAQGLVVAASQRLRSTHPELTPRVLDHLIWRTQRER